MNWVRWFSLPLALVLVALPAPLAGLAQSPDGAPLTAAAKPLGSYFVVQNDASLTEQAPAVAYNSVRHEYRVVWYNDRPGNDDIRAQRLTADSRPLGGPFYISAGTGADRTLPDVAYDDKQDQYLVVWQHQEPSSGYSIHGRRVSGPGLVLDAADIIICSAGYNLLTPANPAVAYAYTSDRYLVVWAESWHPMPISRDVMGQVVSPSGTLDGSAITIADDTTGNFRDMPALAYNRGRNEYLVAWQEYEPGANLWDIYARRVTAAGVLLDPVEIEVCRVSVSSTAPAVAAFANVGTDGQYLVAYELHYAPTDYNIDARPVAADGTILPSFHIAYTGLNETQPALAGSEGSRSFLSAWKRPSGPPFIFTYVEARQVPPSGSPAPAEQYAGGVFAAKPATAAGLGGDFLVVFEETPLGGDTGIYARLFGERTYVPMVLGAYH